MRFITGGELIRDIRNTLGVTQRELGMNKINHNTISMLENGTCELKYKVAIRLCENINEIAASKGLELHITTNSLLEPIEYKCDKWCLQELEQAATLSNTESRIARIKEIIEVAEEHKVIPAITRAIKLLGNIYYDSAKYEDAFFYYLQGAKLLEGSDNLPELAEFYHHIGMALYYSDLEESNKYHFKAYRLLPLLPDSPQHNDLKIKTLYAISLYFARVEDFVQAESYLASLDCLKCTEDSMCIKLHILRANIYLRTKRFDQAIEVLEGLLRYDEEILAPHKYIIYNNLGICLEKKGELQKSIDYLEAAISLQLNNSTMNLTNSLVKSAKLYIKSEIYDIAQRYIEGALTNSLKHQQHSYVIECFKLLYILHKNKKEPSSCKETLSRLESFLIENDFTDKLDTYTLLKLDYMMENNEIDAARQLLSAHLNTI